MDLQTNHESLIDAKSRVWFTKYRDALSKMSFEMAIHAAFVAGCAWYRTKALRAVIDSKTMPDAVLTLRKLI